MINIDTSDTGAERTIYNSFASNVLKQLRSLSYFLVLFSITFLTACGPDDEPNVVHIDKAVFSVEDQKIFGNNLQTVFLTSPELFKPLNRAVYNEIYSHLESTFQILTQTINVENRDEFDWELTILEDDTKLMAFSAPGGKFFIYTGLLKYLSGEHELVALMAHEMYYADSEEAMEVLLDEFKSVPFLLGDIFLGNEIEEAKDVAEYMSEFKYTKEQVALGDMYALQVVCPFQYNPSGLSQFVERSEESINVDWISHREGAEDRVNNLKAMQSECGDIEYDPTFSERYLALVNSLP